MSRYYLFSTVGCHLCEQAEQLLRSLPVTIDYNAQEISENEQWLDRYGIRIPVLHHLSSGDELSWPFDEEILLQFIQRHSPVQPS